MSTLAPFIDNFKYLSRIYPRLAKAPSIFFQWRVLSDPLFYYVENCNCMPSVGFHKHDHRLQNGIYTQFSNSYFISFQNYLFSSKNYNSTSSELVAQSKYGVCQSTFLSHIELLRNIPDSRTSLLLTSSANRTKQVLLYAKVHPTSFWGVKVFDAAEQGILVWILYMWLPLSPSAISVFSLRYDSLLSRSPQ